MGAFIPCRQTVATPIDPALVARYVTCDDCRGSGRQYGLRGEDGPSHVCGGCDGQRGWSEYVTCDGCDTPMDDGFCWSCATPLEQARHLQQIAAGGLVE